MSEDQKFKVVSHPGGTTVNAGPQPKGSPSPRGLSESQAQSDATERNTKAESLGLTTRYEVRAL